MKINLKQLDYDNMISNPCSHFDTSSQTNNLNSQLKQKNKQLMKFDSS